MKQLLCPSMMCADFGNLRKEIGDLDRAGVDIYHCDIMDGQFVPNMTMGINDVKTIRACTDTLVDCHLMIENPGEKVDWFLDMGVDLLYIHPESERYVVKTLSHIKSRGKLAGLAINPDTSIETVRELLPLADYILVMTVSPGFAGQAFLDLTRKKIATLLQMRREYSYKIVIDGACSPEIIKEFTRLGVDGFVLGTSALFNKKEEYSTLIERLRSL
ncbi:ribulose-phosphate 3-epimerase [Streptococcus cuniculi]|uniref:Ribulose-phosphate 3-epimerase n=1 Tax=Streptococcus cuniculi TaxID=1432788 RepID=A0A4Y9J7G6_9STRE|nr:ribulose-phosphate 3-epimerase [Streptococcus cuniculi]MBF0779233.1 ribulose-phosphate 3-epimerase [Streptococcus cuniculi]TFU96782.1 ribulose-phosphate 3-epimerase [Streptococcus cuniculi]